MKVIVTGAGGFLGGRVSALLASEHSPLPVVELVLVDLTLPPAVPALPTITLRRLALDISQPGAADSLIDEGCDIVFHLAAVLSGHAEADFDVGLAVNFDATRSLLEAVRHRSPSARFVFASTVGVYGGRLPIVVDELTATMPQTSYGTAKAMSELLVNDYARRGFVDGRIVRLPTVTVRAGTANRAMTSFASSVVRSPLSRRRTVCPVERGQKMWVSGPRAAVRNVVHAGALPPGALGEWRALALPGLCVAAGDMVAALGTVAGTEVAARVSFDRNDTIAEMVASLPTQFDVTRALKLGFVADSCFEDVVREYIQELEE